MDPVVQGLVEHRESIDIIGEVKCWVRDLEQIWEKENDRRPFDYLTISTLLPYSRRPQGDSDLRVLGKRGWLHAR